MEPILIGIIIIMFGIILYLYHLTKVKYKKGANDIFSLFLNGAYEMRLNWFKTANKYFKNRPSVFVGDSITQEFMLTEMLNEYEVCNRGIGGDTTSGVLKRLNESIFDLNPSQVFLLIGTNDIELLNATSDEIATNIKSICEKTLTEIPDIKINILSILPVTERVHPKIDLNTVGKRTNQQIDVINLKLISLAEELHLEYIDLNSLLKDETNNLSIDYTREGLHLSPMGYEKIVEVIQKYLIK